MAHSRYELRLERLNGASLRYEVPELTEFFDLDDNVEVERVLSKHFIPLACASEQRAVEDYIREMPWLQEYVLRVYEGANTPLLSYRGWRDNWREGWEI